MQGLERKLTDEERVWIKEFFKAKFNATEATKRVYDGTRKKLKKLKKLEPSHNPYRFRTEAIL
jgi:hypothetical protein